MSQPFFNPYLFPLQQQQSQQQQPLSGPYGNSCILNELHNRFPALLYDRQRFGTIQHILQYVQDEMRNQFDTFSNAQRAYRAATYQQINRNMPVVNIPIDILFSSMMGGAPTGFMDSVVVAPSAEQVEAGSAVYQIISPSESPCAICQDVIAIGNVVRKLRGCNHMFHIDCIDTWYQRSALCPTCRHDIRTVVVPTTIPTTTTLPTHMNS